MALQILTIFQTKKVHVPHLFSDPGGGGGGFARFLNVG